MDIFTMVGATNHVVYVHTHVQLFVTLATKILVFAAEFTTLLVHQNFCLIVKWGGFLEELWAAQ